MKYVILVLLTLFVWNAAHADCVPFVKNFKQQGYPVKKYSHDMVVPALDGTPTLVKFRTPQPRFVKPVGKETIQLQDGSQKEVLTFEECI